MYYHSICMNKGKTENVKNQTRYLQNAIQWHHCCANLWVNSYIHLHTKLEGSCQAPNNSYWVFKTELLQLWTECILFIFQVNWRSWGKKLFPCQSLLRWFWRLRWRCFIRENAAVRNSIQTMAPESLKVHYNWTMLIHIHIHFHIQLHSITQTFTSEDTRWWKINTEKKKTKSRGVKNWYETTLYNSFSTMQIKH